MTALEIVKAAYPGIPDAILNEYAELLPAEASALSAEFAQTDFFFDAYKKKLPAKIEDKINLSLYQFNYNIEFQLNFLNPQNSNNTESRIYQSDALYIPIEVATNIYGIGFGPAPDGNWSTVIKPKLFTKYDRRLYSKVENKITFQFEPNGKSFYYNYLSGMHYDTVLAYSGQGCLILSATAQKISFNGIETIVAMHENGVSLATVDYQKAYSFLTYVNAYKKFSTEIDSERAYLQREAEAQLASYRQDYTDRAQREKADLQSKKIQMLMAIDNDTKDATRDFQNMLLNAQNLKQNLRGSIG